MAVMRTRVLAGRYALGEVMGVGGMATVWRATDQVLGREVAVKVLSPQYAADTGFLAQFEREARHAARLTHPSLVTVFDCGVDDGAAFIVMELVAGRTLRQVLDDQGMLPLGEAVGVAAAVCEALEVAHAAGLVHRDIKPANIVISGGDVKVLDFGIARAEGAAGGTRTLGVLGTAAYLSPEQASGSAAGPQADLYSLGCVLFEMLTGTAHLPLTLPLVWTTGMYTMIPARRRRDGQVCPRNWTGLPPSCWRRIHRHGLPRPPRPEPGCSRRCVLMRLPCSPPVQVPSSAEDTTAVGAGLRPWPKWCSAQPSPRRWRA
jgi:serine/threonine protein kinase